MAEASEEKTKILASGLLDKNQCFICPAKFGNGSSYGNHYYSQQHMLMTFWLFGKDGFLQFYKRKDYIKLFGEPGIDIGTQTEPLEINFSESVPCRLRGVKIDSIDQWCFNGDFPTMVTTETQTADEQMAEIFEALVASLFQENELIMDEDEISGGRVVIGGGGEAEVIMGDGEIAGGGVAIMGEGEIAGGGREELIDLSKKAEADQFLAQLANMGDMEFDNFLQVSDQEIYQLLKDSRENPPSL